MVKKFLCSLFRREETVLGGEYAAQRRKLALAGLSESKLRRMPPDDRVTALEKAHLDPYDYIFLAC